VAAPTRFFPAHIVSSHPDSAYCTNPSDTLQVQWHGKHNDSRHITKHLFPEEICFFLTRDIQRKSEIYQSQASDIWVRSVGSGTPRGHPTTAGRGGDRGAWVVTTTLGASPTTSDWGTVPGLLSLPTRLGDTTAKDHPHGRWQPPEGSPAGMLGGGGGGGLAFNPLQGYSANNDQITKWGLISNGASWHHMKYLNGVFWRNGVIIPPIFSKVSLPCGIACQHILILSYSTVCLGLPDYCSVH
jgi:hypothetical protein